jgi:hypothetical protein
MLLLGEYARELGKYARSKPIIIRTCRGNPSRLPF